VPSVMVNIAGIKGENQWELLYDVNVVSNNWNKPDSRESELVKQRN
jgi:hypothetical protein